MNNAIELTIDEARYIARLVNQWRGQPPSTARLFIYRRGHGRTVLYSACGNKLCGVSTGICESTTFGSGELSESGYWEFPCAICARDRESRYPDEGECWPFREKENA